MRDDTLVVGEMWYETWRDVEKMPRRDVDSRYERLRKDETRYDGGHLSHIKKLRVCLDR